MKKHIHADLIHAWADGAEIEQYCPAHGWVLRESPSWLPRVKYRTKAQTRTINGFEVPMPLTIEQAKSADIEFYMEDLTQDCYYLRNRPTSKNVGRIALNRGVAYLTKEAAVANCKARLNIDPNEG